METQILPITQESLTLAAGLINQGKLVAFPTETVYGLGADALNKAAVPAIFAAKGRPGDNPLIAHICGWDMGESLARFTPLARRLAEKFWPGPLTLVVEKRPVVPEVVTAGLDSVGLRWPSHPAAAALIVASRTPIAAPSANLSGRPSPTLARHVLEDLAGRVPLILDGGPVDIGLESTVVDARGDLPLLLRPGRVTYEDLAEAAGGCLLPQGGAPDRPIAPGMKYRHYAPQGQVYLVRDWRQAEALASRLNEPLFILDDQGCHALSQAGVASSRLLSLGASQEDFAKRLFSCLRQADSLQAGQIICQECDEAGLGRAIMNRLRKAAAGK